MTETTASKAGAAGRAMILPLALAQFIASYAATNMNVAISAIAQDLGTTVAGHNDWLGGAAHGRHQPVPSTGNGGPHSQPVMTVGRSPRRR